MSLENVIEKCIQMRVLQVPKCHEWNYLSMKIKTEEGLLCLLPKPTHTNERSNTSGEF